MTSTRTRRHHHRPHRRGLTAAAATASTLLLAAGCSTATGDEGDAAAEAGELPDTLTVAAIPAENSQSLAEGFDPIVALLEEETGSEVELVQASDYAGVVEGLIAGNVDLAFLGCAAT